MTFKDKVVVITGASSGIGSELARVFAEKGAKLAITGRNKERLKSVSEQCFKISGQLPLEIITDITIDDEAKIVVKKTIAHYKRLDILINNAGVMLLNSILNDDFIQTFDQVLSVNLRSSVILMKESAPYLIEAKGNIVNISSQLSTSPFAGGAPYCASKAAIDHVTRCVALELASKGVRVNTVNPGPVHTEVMLNLGDAEKIKSIAKAYVPLPAVTTPIDVAELVTFLASDKARSITGSSFIIDSGCALKGAASLIELLNQ